MQMALTPLYGASAALPVVMVSDTAAQKELLAQAGTLLTINGTLITLNKTQTDTNKKLDQILGAIKYQPNPESKDIPTTDTILAEFTSSLYAAYTSDSIAYNTIREGPAAAAAVAKVNASAAPAGTPATSGTPAPAGTPARKDGSTLEGFFKDNTSSIETDPRARPFNLRHLDKGDNPFDDSTPPLVSSTVPANEFSGAFDSSPSTNSTLGYTLKDSLIAKPSDPLGNIANFTDMAVQLAGDSAKTFYNFQSLQNCGNAINCASSGLNTFTGVLGTLKDYGINIGDAKFQENLGYVGAAVSFASLVTNLFSGKFNAQKLLQFINGMQQNILFSAISKGGLLTNDTNESKILRIMSNFTTLFGYAGLFALQGTESVQYIVLAKQSFELGNRFGTKDTPKTGPLSKDTPLAGPTNPAKQPPTTEVTAEFLRSMLRCNPQMANNSTSKCKQIEEANKRLFLGQLKSRCAAAAISKQQIPAKMFQELFLGTSNPDRCNRTALYKTKDGKELCPSINTLQSASMGEGGAVSSQMNVLIGLSMYNLVMTNVNTEQVILQNACASLGDLITSGAPVYQPND
jgi:hypothetical protein